MSKFPIYLDNIIFSLQKTGGISVYWYELIRKFASSSQPLVLFHHGATEKNMEKIKLFDNITIRRERGFLPTKVIRYLPLQVRLKEPSIFHSSYYRIAKQKNVANIVTVYDFTYERFRRGLPRLLHSCQKRFALNRADGIICISESTKNDLFHYFPELKKKDIDVIYLGVSDVFHVVNDTQAVDKKIREITSTKYVIFVGQRTAYKNFDVAVDVVSKMVDFKLLVVGGGELLSRELSNMKQKLDGRFWHFPEADDKFLNILYNYAFCLLYPSSYEGFGMPVVEAMSAGCPVIAVKVSSIPEACNRAGLLVGNLKAKDFIGKIRLLENASFRKEIVREGIKQAGKFSWNKCYQQTKEFYRKVFFEKFGIPVQR